MNLHDLKNELLEDGIIDANEVQKLKDILYADGIIDKDEADFLFEINDAVSGKNNDQEWDMFFAQAICDFLLKDENSPGVIDEQEAAWLLEKVGADGKVDDVEKALLVKLQSEAKNFPSELSKLL